MEKNSKIYVAGHKGLVGSALLRRLKSVGYENIIVRTHDELDLTDQRKVAEFFRNEKPEYVFLAAAKVGGIMANSTYPADFIMQNLMIQCNVIKSSFDNCVKKLLFLGSSCIYPRTCPQPIKEEYLLTGELEQTNEAYALAKIAGLKMCQYYNLQYGTRYISVMPSNLYGPNDNYDLRDSHVLPALIRKIHEAKLAGAPTVEIWGTGKPKREFLYVDDMADACVFLMEKYDGNEAVNIGTGEDISIGDLAGCIKDIIGYNGELVYATDKPDGVSRKLLDVSKLKALGWSYKTCLKDGITATYEAYKTFENIKFSIITPSYNHGRFIEDNILSVLNQNYKNYEHIIIDGGSTDGTVEILKRYPHLIWVSEKDDGQSNAINKGLKAASGDIVIWINSDDMLCEDALQNAADKFAADSSLIAVSGNCAVIDEKGQLVRISKSTSYTKFKLIHLIHRICQPATFIKRSVWEKAGGLDETLHYSMDYDLFIRVCSMGRIQSIDCNLAYYREHSGTKTHNNRLKQILECLRIRRKYTWFTPTDFIIYLRIVKYIIEDDLLVKIGIRSRH